MKLWRNSEGREFPGPRRSGTDALLESAYHAFINLGYELVEDSPDSSVSAEQVGAPSAIEPSARNDESVRLSQRDVLRLLGAFNQVQQEFLDKIRKVSKPPQNPPTEAVTEEFEVVCVENREASERWPHLTPVLIHVGLIPGKTYVVRLKESE